MGALRTVLLTSLLVGLIVTVACFWLSTTADSKYALSRNVLAHTRSALYMTAGKMELHVKGQAARRVASCHIDRGDCV